MANSETVGIIIVDHGSRIAEANAMLEDVVALFRDQTQATIVEAAHMELAEPSIADAFARCVKQGATRVVVHPYMLSSGRHSTIDIPRFAAEAAAVHRDIPFCVTEPLGVDARIADVIAARIDAALDGNAV